MTDYRNDARRELARAKDELASADDERLKYAALELRMAMESLTYDRALAYKDEFPPAEYQAWQPRKVMALLLEIDPNADKDSSLAFGIEPALGVTPDEMQSLGTECVLNMATIKRHYDALGSYLHVPTIKQRKDSAKLDPVKFRARCDEIAAYLTDVLASPMWNATIGIFVSPRLHEMRPSGPQAYAAWQSCGRCDVLRMWRDLQGHRRRKGQGAFRAGPSRGQMCQPGL